MPASAPPFKSTPRSPAQLRPIGRALLVWSFPLPVLLLPSLETVKADSLPRRGPALPTSRDEGQERGREMNRWQRARFALLVAAGSTGAVLAVLAVLLLAGRWLALPHTGEWRWDWAQATENQRIALARRMVNDSVLIGHSAEECSQVIGPASVTSECIELLGIPNHAWWFVGTEKELLGDARDFDLVVAFDDQGRTISVHVTSSGYRPGPLRRVWEDWTVVY